jgi:hypothetical protein
MLAWRITPPRTIPSIAALELGTTLMLNASTAEPRSASAIQMLNIELYRNIKRQSRVIQGHISDGRWLHRGLPLFKDGRKGRGAQGAFFNHELTRAAPCVALPGIAAD